MTTSKILEYLSILTCFNSISLIFTIYKFTFLIYKLVSLFACYFT